jgi:hypothetical protein
VLATIQQLRAHVAASQIAHAPTIAVGVRVRMNWVSLERRGTVTADMNGLWEVHWDGEAAWNRTLHHAQELLPLAPVQPAPIAAHAYRFDPMDIDEMEDEL